MIKNTLNAAIIATGLIVGALVLRDAGMFSAERDAAASVVDQSAATSSDDRPLTHHEIAFPGPSGAALRKHLDGMYWADALVNRGSHIRFMVDTGATKCVLTHADAEKLGIHWRELPHDVTISTAGGEVLGSRVMIDQIKISQVTVNNVEAIVLKKDLDQSLLGLSFLDRVREVRKTSKAIVIYQ